MASPLRLPVALGLLGLMTAAVYLAFASSGDVDPGAAPDSIAQGSTDPPPSSPTSTAGDGGSGEDDRDGSAIERDSEVEADGGDQSNQLEIDFEAINGVITLSGALPSDSHIDLLAERAAQIYGRENLINELELDSDVVTNFDLDQLPDIIGLLGLAGDYEIKSLDSGFFIAVERGVEFELGTAELTEQSRAAVRALADVFSRFEEDVSISGHTDSFGDAQINLELSKQRAEVVASELESNGIDPDRIEVEWLGETEPVASNSSTSGRAKNRRVLITMGSEDA